MKKLLLFIILLCLFKASPAEGTSNQLRPGRIDAYAIADAHASYKVLPIKSIVEIAGSTVFHKQIYQAYGSPSIGGIYYVSIMFDQMLR